MTTIFTYDLREKNPESNHFVHLASILAKNITRLLMPFFICSIPSFVNAQDVLAGLTSNGGPEGKGTAFTIKTNGTNYSIIKSFANWGEYPAGDLIKGNDGNYYGMTPNGGVYDYGTVFMMTPSGIITVLKNFDYTNDGGNPNGELVKDNAGNFWGLTMGGGANTYGTIFKITPAGVFTVIRNLGFADGTNPRGHLVFGADGNFYGLTYHGGANGVGTVFKITPSGTFTVLHSLVLATEGGNSLSSLTEGKDGNLYGITYSGGAKSSGTIFKTTKGGAFSVLHSFDPTPDGGSSQGELIQATDNNFYGMCYTGGSGGTGTVFKMTPAGGYAVLHHFIWTTDGSNPYGNLFQNTDGNLYGLTSGGGPTRKGVFFKITLGGTFNVLHGFNDTTEGSAPKGSLIRGTDGNLYGMTSAGGKNFRGTAFKLTTAGACTVLASFDGGTQGHEPYESLVKGNDSAFYGTTSSGGAYNYGTVFKICAGKTTVLRSFNRPTDGGTPKGSLVLASNGSFYGMTTEGGTFSYGTIFKITSSGAFTVLRHLNIAADGSKPQGSLIQGKDGNLYGMTSGGGSNNSGTIFKITLSGTFTVLHHFIAASEGSAPEGSLMQDTDSTLYGMTSNSARIFKIKPNGTSFAVMRTMSSADGSAPTGGFVKGPDGNFYAMASLGGANGFGTIFRISPAGSFQVIKNLSAATDGKTPKGNLLLAKDGNFYGMTSAGGAKNAGTLFKITTAGTFTVLKNFDLVADGGTPFGALIIAPVNNLMANAQSVTTAEDTKKVITLAGSGGSPLTYNIVANPKHGSLTGTGANRTYTPAANYSGSDQFSFNVSVGCVASAPAIVSITVTPVNDTPVLAPIGNKTVVKNTQLTFTATATDPDANQTRSFSLISAPAGAAINASTGVFTWTPTQTGSFIFKVRVTDNGTPALFDEEQITVTVTASLTAASEAADNMKLHEFITLAVYPNPAKDKLTVTFGSIPDEASIRIVNMNGIVMGTVDKVAGKANTDINISQLKPGIYALQLKTEHTVQTVKFVKE